MSYSDILEKIFIYGGRNDSIDENGFLDDMFVLSMDLLQWLKVSFVGIPK